MPGFIHDKLDIKLLILYIMTRIVAPIDFTTLTDLSMCDDGVDYFVFAEAVAELVKSGHLSHENECYFVTDKGRRDGAAGESSLSKVIRNRCDQRLAPLNAALQRKAQVRSEVTPLLDESGYSVRLSLGDSQGTFFSLTLLASTKQDGEQIATRFSEHPDQIYNGILGVLLSDNYRSEES